MIDTMIDEHAVRIRELIVATCLVSQPEAVLLHARCELVALATDTTEAEAADDAWGAVAEIDAAVAPHAGGSAHRKAS